MQKTEHYQLNLWDKSDRIQMEDFNADNAKVEQALTEHAAILAGCGNCKIVYGSYTGTGTYGENNKNKLTFEHKPILIFVLGSDYEEELDRKLRMAFNITWAAGVDGSHYWNNTVSWNEKTVQWYNFNDATAQFNTKGTTYLYFAFVAADE